jgi:cytochrome b561
VARFLHWAIFLAIGLQFVIGYAMDRFDDLLEGPVDRWFGGEEENLLLVHASLGVLILVLATWRAIWRRFAGLPPWAPTLSEGERRLAHATEITLYFLMFLIPLTGLGLLFASGEEWEIWGREWESPIELADDDVLLAGHIATHVLFLVAFAAHLGLVLKHQFVDRDRLLRRML